MTHDAFISKGILGVSVLILFNNKKVLLRERKRPTARHIANAHYAGGVGTPYPRVPPWPDLRWVPPIQTLDGVHPRPDLGWGNPPVQTWDGVPPPSSRSGMGYPPIQTWDRIPPRPGMGYQPPAMVNRQTFPSINITFPRTTYAGGKNVIDKRCDWKGWRRSLRVSITRCRPGVDRPLRGPLPFNQP